MKAAKRAIFLLIAVVILALVPGNQKTGFSVSSQPAGAETQSIKMELAFISANSDDMDLITKETRRVKADSGINRVELIVNELLAGPNTARAKSLIPKETTLKEVERDAEGNLLVVLDPGTATIERADSVLIRSTVALSLCNNLENVTKVGVYFSDIQRDLKGNPTGLLSTADIVLDDQISKTGEQQMTIYYPDTATGTLRPVNTTLYGSSAEPMEQTVVSRLFAGDDSENAKTQQALFNQNSKLISSFTDKGIFFLNFSEPFLSGQATDEQRELAVYALVNTMAELKGDGVCIQILIKGKTADDLAALAPEGYFTKNMDFVEE